ncbi:MAG: ABC transporter permease [Chloroflexi bacterium]|nr:MAG: ABC transporter permease [Chloroflexota bacterium]
MKPKTQNSKLWYSLLWSLGPIVTALLFTALLLLAVGAPPFRPFVEIFRGALESPQKWADVATAWVPLALVGAGMSLTFAGGLWNIGAEGQIILGAIFAAWVARNVMLPQPLLLALIVMAGLLGGALWGLLTGALRVYAHVHEIFAGLGMNFIAMALIIWLIFNPWKPARGATMSGTEPFPVAAWIPRLGDTRMSPLAVILAVIAVLVAYFLLKGTRFGLELRAMGKNTRAAFMQGVPTNNRMLLAFVLCGALAGLAGALQSTAVYHRLIPRISGGMGYTGMLVVILAGFRPELVPAVALFFAVVGVGSPRLEMNMQLDASLGGVLEGAIVLFVLLFAGLRKQLEGRQTRDAS